MKIRAIKVGELGEYIAQALRYDHILQNVYVEGEISNFKIHSTGNIYFTLKDEQHKIRCIMFQGSYEDDEDLRRISVGDQLLCKGSISYYQKEGYVSFVVSAVQRLGESIAYQNFLETKLELEKEGLFDDKYKKPLPSYPSRIGIVTSVTGAVIQDIYHVIKRRFPAVELLVYPALVQGSNAAEEIIEGLSFLDDEAVDVIILARGGGSYEELDVFNSKEIAYAIFNTKAPVISAIGHETDFTISDFVADVRAATPSVAAEIAVPVLTDLLKRITLTKNNLLTAMNRVISSREQKILAKRNLLQAYSPDKMIDATKGKLLLKRSRLDILLKDIIAYKSENLDQRIRLLNAYNPDQVFDCGGVFLSARSGARIDSVKELSEGMDALITLKDGRCIVKVTEIL